MNAALLEGWLHLEQVLAWEKKRGLLASEDEDRERWIEIVRKHNGTEGVVMVAAWQPIETALKEWRIIPCSWRGREGWQPLTWKTNRRTSRSYFGDPNESDDYDLADDQPTHWFNLPDIPT